MTVTQKLVGALMEMGLQEEILGRRESEAQEKDLD